MALKNREISFFRISDELRLATLVRNHPITSYEYALKVLNTTPKEMEKILSKWLTQEHVSDAGKKWALYAKNKQKHSIKKALNERPGKQLDKIAKEIKSTARLVKELKKEL